jgi:hypothetical protein
MTPIFLTKQLLGCHPSVLGHATVAPCVSFVNLRIVVRESSASASNYTNS